MVSFVCLEICHLGCLIYRELNVYRVEREIETGIFEMIWQGFIITVEDVFRMFWIQYLKPVTQQTV